MKEKRFRSLDRFMKYVKGVTWEEAEKMGLPKGSKHLVEEMSGYLCIFACTEGLKLAREYADKHNLNIMTETIEDMDNGTIFLTDNELHFCNRERFYFSRTKKKASCKEVCILDN